MKIPFLFTFLTFFPLARCQDDPLVPFPELPKFFSTNMQANIRQTERSTTGGEPVEGVTVSMYEAVDESLARAVFEYNYELNGETQGFIVREKVIWNAILDDSFKFLHIASIDKDAICRADQVDDDSFLEAIFGLNSDASMPSVTHFLHFGKRDYVYNGTEEMMGMRAHKYIGKIHIDRINADFDVVYYWTDPLLWMGSAGYNRSVPLSVHIGGHYTLSKVEKNLDMFITFENFKEEEPSHHHFYPPSDIWCENRTPKHKLPTLPLAFTYDMESIIHWQPPDSIPINVIRKQTEYYDYIMLVSRSDYKPLDFDHISDPFEGHLGTVRDVKDFHSGVSYKTYEDFGNCSAEFIGFDLTGDATAGPDGHFHMTSPLQFWNLNKNFSFNGIHESRNIYMASYVSMETFGKESKVNFTTAIQLSAGNYVGEGESDIQYSVPVRFEIYEQQFYNDPLYRVRHNIIGFMNHVPDFRHYDITACFTEEAIAHREIKLGWRSDLAIEQEPREFDTRVRRAIHLASRITPIRVQNIEFDIRPDEEAMYVIFSIVDWPSNVNKSSHVNIPPESTRPLHEAIENLKNVVESGKFSVDLPIINSNKTVIVKAADDYFETIERTSYRTEHSDGKYSPGAMAGLGICMLLISSGFALFLLVKVLKW